jgi:hypothetical protein
LARSAPIRNALILGAGLAILACGTVLQIDADDPTPPRVDPPDGGDASPADAQCARNCLGRACRDDVCEPQLLAQGYGSVQKIAIDDDALYFTSADQWMLGRVGKDGGAATVLVPEGGLREPTSGLVADGAYVYASAYTAGAGAGARRVPKEGGPEEAIDVCNTTWGLTVDATDVYWVTGICGGHPRMRRRAKDDPDAAGVATSQEDDPSFYPYATSGDTSFDATDVYWMSTRQLKRLGKVGIEDGGPVTVYEPEGADRDKLRALVVADRLYAMLGNRVIAVAKSGGAPTILADAAPIKTSARAGIVVADGNVYFTRPEEGVVARVPTTGGAVETLAKGQAMPTGLAVDAQYIYWSNAGDGTIWRAAR